MLYEVTEISNDEEKINLLYKSLQEFIKKYKITSFSRDISTELGVDRRLTIILDGLVKEEKEG